MFWLKQNFISSFSLICCIVSIRLIYFISVCLWFYYCTYYFRVKYCLFLLVFRLSRFRLLSLLLSCFRFHSGFLSSSAYVSSFIPAPSSFSSSSFPFPLFLLPLSARHVSSFYFLVSLSPFFSPSCCFFSSFGFPMLHSLCSAISASSLVGLLFLFAFSFFVSFSSSSSLGFPPSFSFPPSFLIFSPDLTVLLFSHLRLLLLSPLPLFLCLLLLLWFFLSFFFSSSIGLFFLPFSFLLLPLPFVCVFLPPLVPFSSSSSFSASFRCFLFLSFFALFFHRFPFVCTCILAICGVSFRLSLLFSPFGCLHHYYYYYQPDCKPQLIEQNAITPKAIPRRKR